MIKTAYGSAEEIKYCYHHFIKEYFPVNEIKPLHSIMKMWKDGLYKCLVLFDNEVISGAAFYMTYPGGKSYLLDYLVVDQKVRSKGYGGMLLKELRNQLGDSPVYIETESIESARTKEEVEQREKRNAFYRRNGAVMEELVTDIFKTEYNIWSLNPSSLNPETEMKKLYGYMVAPFLYKLNVFIPAETKNANN